MDHDVVGMQTQKQRRKDRVVVDAVEFDAVNAAERRPRAAPGHRECSSGLTKLGISAQKRPLGKIVSSAIRGRKLIELRMHERAMVALGVVDKDELPVAGEIVGQASRRLQRADVPPGEAPDQRAKACSNGNRSSARLTKMKPSQSATAALLSGYSARSNPGTSAMLRATFSAPSRPYVQAWYGH